MLYGQYFNRTSTQSVIQQYRNTQISEVIAFYQRCVERQIKDDIHINGLGNYQDAQHYYEWAPVEWYIKRVKQGKLKGTSFDFLSLAYLSSRKDGQIMKEGQQWYRSQIAKYNKDYRLLFGLANLLFNKGSFYQARQHYNAIVQTQRDCIKAWQSLCLTYHNLKGYQLKFKSTLKKILQLDRTNRMGLFLEAMNESAKYTRMNNLQYLTKIHPDYTRAFFEIGMISKQIPLTLRQTIKYFRKCHRNAPLFHQCHLQIAKMYHSSQSQKQLLWSLRSIHSRPNYIPPSKINELSQSLNTDNGIIHKDYFFYYIGRYQYKRWRAKEAINFLIKSIHCADQIQDQLYKVYYFIGKSYFDLKDYEGALKNFMLADKLKPNYDNIVFQIAKTLSNLQRQQEAYVWYTKLLELKPAPEDEIIAVARVTFFLYKFKLYRPFYQYLQKLSKWQSKLHTLSVDSEQKAVFVDTLHVFRNQLMEWKKKGTQKCIVQEYVRLYETIFEKVYSNEEESGKLLTT